MLTTSIDNINQYNDNSLPDYDAILQAIKTIKDSNLPDSYKHSFDISSSGTKLEMFICKQ